MHIATNGLMGSK